MQQRLRELFARHKHLTTAEVRKLLAVSSSTATSYLHRLCAEYCIEKVRPTPSPQSHYFRAKSVVASVAEIQAATRNTTQISTHKPSRTTTPKTSERIVALVRQDPRITRRKLAALIGITEDGVKYHLRALQKAGALKRVGPVNGGHWEATAPAVPLETDNSESDT
jgi:predicted HTH transcriptional regulator